MLKSPNKYEAKTTLGKELRKNLPADVVIDCTFFLGYVTPNGFLDSTPETHALFYYYVHARRTYEDFIKNEPLVMEGDPDPQYNFKQLFESIAAMYDVYPENMVNAWAQIDKQCELLQLPKLPHERQYRHTHVIQLIN